jgi:ADP-heptose:LPS heptosyltransferase
MGATPDTEDLSVPVISRESKKSAMEKLRCAGVDLNKKWVIVHPGVSEEKRQYPPAMFAKTAEAIAESLDTQVLVTGVKEEKVLVAKVAGNNKKIFPLAGKFSVEEFITLIKVSSLLISNNTGPVHIAAAVKTPVIVLYALTNPQHLPWNVPHKVFPFDVPASARSRNIIIKFAYESCFLNEPEPISPELIVKTAEELIESKDKPERTELLLL